jgi:xanthine/uracil/vitamin C permease (AzgA family)
MAVTFNIAGGFVLYPISKMVSGTASELKPGMWVLTGLSLLFFVF